MFWSRVGAGLTQMLSKWVTSEPSALGCESSWGTLVTTARVLEGEERLHEQVSAA